MYLTSNLDFLPLNRLFRLSITWIAPAALSLFLGTLWGWIEWSGTLGVVVLSWPGLMTLLMGLMLQALPLTRVLRYEQYVFALLGHYAGRALLIFVLSVVLFVLASPSALLPWRSLAQHALCVWLLLCVQSVLLIELGMRPWFRRKPARLAVAAVTDASVAFARGLKAQRFVNIDFVGFFEDRDDSRIPAYAPFAILGRFDQIDTYMAHAQQAHTRLHHMVVSLPTQASYRFGAVLEHLLDSTCSVHYLHDFLLFKPIREAMTTVGNLSVFTIIDAPTGGYDRWLKRVMDFTLSLTALLALAPLLLLVALWIKLDSKGSVFFKQKRWGTGAEPFEIYKFRSMSAQTSAGASSGEQVVQTTKNDLRVTKVGAFIRRTSIDELPQLLNILRGDMSLVGPRPHATGHNMQYRGLIRGYMLRHKIKPGLTGWAQIHGFRGETETLDKMEGRVAYDLDYLRQWTPLLDLYIIARTGWLVVSGKNAY